jgi:hypothetical protein
VIYEIYRDVWYWRGLTRRTYLAVPQMKSSARFDLLKTLDRPQLVKTVTVMVELEPEDLERELRKACDRARRDDDHKMFEVGAGV